MAMPLSFAVGYLRHVTDGYGKTTGGIGIDTQCDRSLPDALASLTDSDGRNGSGNGLMTDGNGFVCAGIGGLYR